jgi:UDP-N-acetylmuramoylalanine--D-glutamate ligase
VSDLRTADELSETLAELGDLDLEFALGDHPARLLDGADLLCLSGGVPTDLPLAQQARTRGIPLSNDSQIFFELSPAKTIGITGSAGKTTTTALLAAMAQQEFVERGIRIWVGGNIGNPLLNDLDQIRPDDLVISELSSFQLDLMTVSPNVAAILNITPNHLDRHPSMEAYTQVKARILEFQNSEGIAVLGRDDPVTWSLREQVRGDLCSFGKSEIASGSGTYLEGDEIFIREGSSSQRIMPLQSIPLRGEHNLENVLAAAAIAVMIGCSPEAIRDAVETFPGIPHRLEPVLEHGGILWINDSIATAPERTMAAIRSFDRPIVLMLGGRDKDLPWDSLIELLAARVDHVILFGELAEKVVKHIYRRFPDERLFSVDQVSDLESAVQLASQIAATGDVVLLSPGGTSFDSFVDFEERGERFRELVSAL